MVDETKQLRDYLIRLEAKIDAGFSSLAQTYVPRNELNEMNKNSDRQRVTLNNRVEHIDKEVTKLKTQVEDILTTFRNYTFIAGIILAIVQSIVTAMLINFLM